MLAVVQDVAPVLPVREIVLAQVGSGQQHRVIEDVCLDVVDPKDFSEGPVAALALEIAGVRVVVEGEAQVFLVLLDLDLLEHIEGALALAVEPGAAHVVEEEVDAQVVRALDLVAQLLDQELLELAGAQVERAHADSALALLN
eukprot:CAMPEP_0168614540 /NCGR_PEP_ID=MMETSP0449_2-20121227/4028_1 /TAXON_ID=1082188 /ORGANISM="Strombidium rassoulzadegani, Strain ras09" /LENGTH=142 /DNA_ID=CAMNT_0008655225 /DNA_START=1193 /DNA_END=1621 /DNA_ORIENTATION=-